MRKSFWHSGAMTARQFLIREVTLQTQKELCWQPVYNVILDCSVLNDDEKYVEPTINALVSCFPDLTSEQLYSYLKDSPDSRYIVLAKRLSYDTIQPFVNLQEERDEKGKLVNPYIKGVWFEKE